MAKGWGYRNRASLSDLLLRSKRVSNINGDVTVYKSFGALNTVEVILHDRRKTKTRSQAILKDVHGHTKVLDVADHFKSFKEVFNFIALHFENGFMYGFTVQEKERVLNVSK